MSQQELLIESKQLTRFIKDAKSLITTTPNSKALISQLTRPFIKILSADFIPKSFMEPLPSTFAQYLIYRNFSPEFSLMAMLVPPGISTPVHDHLAWGLVGVYQGEQKETVYSSRKISESHQSIMSAGTNLLHEGDVTVILPPDDDIHMIETISTIPSISLHLLGNDIGCKIRHSYDPSSGAVTDFQSGYINAACHQ